MDESLRTIFRCGIGASPWIAEQSQKKARSEKPQPGRRATKTKTDYMTSKMKYLEATLGYQIIATSIVPKASPSNVLIGGLVPVSPGFPIEAFGNDGL